MGVCRFEYVRLSEVQEPLLVNKPGHNVKRPSAAKRSYTQNNPTNCPFVNTLFYAADMQTEQDNDEAYGLTNSLQARVVRQQRGIQLDTQHAGPGGGRTSYLLE